MAVTDPIADFLTRIRNAVLRRKQEVRVRSSKIALAIAETLQAEGFILGLEIVPNPRTPVQNDVLLRLKYGPRGEPVITRILRLSRPGCRKYAQVSQLKPVLRGLGILILSTPKGVLSDRQARQAKVGGELLCRVE
jgi:small subunit ribosomal protein S8